MARVAPPGRWRTPPRTEAGILLCGRSGACGIPHIASTIPVELKAAAHQRFAMWRRRESSSDRGHRRRAKLLLFASFRRHSIKKCRRRRQRQKQGEKPVALIRTAFTIAAMALLSACAVSRSEITIPPEASTQPANGVAVVVSPTDARKFEAAPASPSIPSLKERRKSMIRRSRRGRWPASATATAPR